MKHYFETALPPVWTAVCAAAFGLLLAIYPALAGVIDKLGIGRLEWNMPLQEWHET